MNKRSIMTYALRKAHRKIKNKKKLLNEMNGAKCEE